MYFLIGFLILYGLVDVHYVQPEFGLTIAIIPVMMIQATCTIIFTKSENMIGAIAAIVRPFPLISHHPYLRHLTSLPRSFVSPNWPI